MFNTLYLKFGNVPCRSITEQDILLFMNDNGTKRFNMRYTQPNALKPGEGDIIAWFNTPFLEPINALLSPKLGYSPLLYQSSSNSGGYRFFKEANEYEKFRTAISMYSDLVFLRDCLDLSIALSMHESIPDVRTELGEAEYQVKYYQPQGEHLQLLIDQMQYWIETLPYFKHADCICCIPSSRPFMRDIVNYLKGFRFENISEKVNWLNKNDEIKGKPTEEKLRLLKQFCLQVDCDVQGKAVLLVDDMYQSGLTMQYVAMTMKQLGAKYVFGISLVKALTNA